MKRTKPKRTAPAPASVSVALLFHLLGREAQLRDLLARRRLLREATAAYLANLALWNQTQESRGDEPLGRDRQMEAQLDWLDKQIAADNAGDAA